MKQKELVSEYVSVSAAVYRNRIGTEKMCTDLSLTWSRNFYKDVIFFN